MATISAAASPRCAAAPPTTRAASSSSCARSPVWVRKGFHGASVSRAVAGRPSTCLKFSPLPPVRATTSEDTSTEEVSKQVEDIVSDLKAKWDGIENKSSVVIYTGGAVVALWFSTTIVGAINSVPLLPKVLELVGLGYTGWFVYRYLLFKSSRKELLEDIEELKKRITGATE